jgi:outer membrane protein
MKINTKMMCRRIFVLTLTLVLGKSMQAQDTLRLEDAVRQGLENNLSIVVAKNNLETARINNTWEWALPTLGLNANQTNNITNSKQVLFSGPPREGSNLRASSINASAMANWTIFDGMNMFVTKEKLEEYERLGETQTRLAIEDVVSRIVVGYYNVVLQTKMLEQWHEAVAISQQRRRLVETRLMVGTASQLNTMQAQADLNADSSALLRQQVALKNARAELNRLMGREVSIPFQVSQNIYLDQNLVYEQLQQQTKSQNAELLTARQNERIAELSLGQAKSQRYPALNLFAGYNYNRASFAIGFAQFTRNYGPSYGASVSWNLYSGGTTNRAIQNARIQKLSQEAQRKDLELQLSNELYKLYNQYEMNIHLVQLEQSNVTVTEKNVAVALERYKIGSLTDLELREIQSSFLEASARLMNAVYEAKQSETELLRLSGELLR